VDDTNPNATIGRNESTSQRKDCEFRMIHADRSGAGCWNLLVAGEGDMRRSRKLRRPQQMSDRRHRRGESRIIEAAIARIESA